MSEDQNQHSEEGSFKEQIMRALEEGRKNREVEPTKKASSISAGPSKTKRILVMTTIWLRLMSVYLAIDKRKNQLLLSESLSRLKKR